MRAILVGLAAWLPFFVLWVLVAMSFGPASFRSALVESLIAMGMAGALSTGVWFASRRWPWPHGFRFRFYGLQCLLALLYGIVWASAVYALEGLRGEQTADTWSAFTRQAALGVWFYAVSAGISHAVQTRTRLHEQEMLAVRAEALASAAGLQALRARLNPHFLFNALHTLMALVRFRPSVAEAAIERLGEMLRYTLKEDDRGLVSFSEEFAFTQQYIDFEQLRYGTRFNIQFDIDPASSEFDVPPFCIQTLAENAVRHAVAQRPEGGSVWITSRRCEDGLHISVRDDGVGSNPRDEDSHQIGLRSVRERLRAAFGPDADVRIESRDGFHVAFLVPLTDDVSGRVD